MLYTQLLIPVILLTASVDVFVCLLESNLGHLFCGEHSTPGLQGLMREEFWWVLDDNSD